MSLERTWISTKLQKPNFTKIIATKVNKSKSLVVGL